MIRLGARPGTGVIRGAALVASAWLLAAVPPSSGADGKRLPPFDLKLLGGPTVRSQDLTGKVLVIDFWATWCEPCLAEVDDYNRLFRDYRGRLELLAIACDSGGEGEVRTAAEELDIAYPIAVPTPEQLERFGPIEMLPTTWVVDGSGVVVREFKGSGPGKHASLRALIERLLAR